LLSHMTLTYLFSTEVTRRTKIAFFRYVLLTCDKIIQEIKITQIGYGLSTDTYIFPPTSHFRLIWGVLGSKI